jgi:hypothetical protein
MQINYSLFVRLLVKNKKYYVLNVYYIDTHHSLKHCRVYVKVGETIIWNIQNFVKFGQRAVLKIL